MSEVSQVPVWVQYLTPVSSLILGLAGLWIGYSQQKLAKSKILYEMFDRRYTIYQAFRKLVYFSNSKNHPEAEDFSPLFEQIDAAAFLFSQKMANDLRNFAFHGREWVRLERRGDVSRIEQNSIRDWAKATTHSEQFDLLAKSLEQDFLKLMKMAI